LSTVKSTVEQSESRKQQLDRVKATAEQCEKQQLSTVKSKVEQGTVKSTVEHSERHS
jgi:hypothetical protein